MVTTIYICFSHQAQLYHVIRQDKLTYSVSNFTNSGTVLKFGIFLLQCFNYNMLAVSANTVRLEKQLIL
jgi:hypothetical protein